MSQYERLEKMKSLLKERQTLTYHDLMETFDISRDTARRDILKLVNSGLAIRTYGGLMLNAREAVNMHYDERAQINVALKKQLAQRALTYMNDRKMIYFDASTTINEICRLVPGDIQGYSVSIPNLETLSSCCEAYGFGGHYEPNERYMYGTELFSQLEAVHFDLAYMGAASVREDGLYFQNKDNAYTKHFIAKRAAFVVVVYDDSKYEKNGHFKGLSFDEINVLITNKQPPEKIAQQIREAGCVIDVVEEKENEDNSI
jgi:DeoR/GlpR family transcriptional regulator of sugar metabolism